MSDKGGMTTCRTRGRIFKSPHAFCIFPDPYIHLPVLARAIRSDERESDNLGATGRFVGICIFVAWKKQHLVII